MQSFDIQMHNSCVHCRTCGCNNTHLCLDAVCCAVSGAELVLPWQPAAAAAHWSSPVHVLNLLFSQLTGPMLSVPGHATAIMAEAVNLTCRPHLSPACRTGPIVRSAYVRCELLLGGAWQRQLPNCAMGNFCKLCIPQQQTEVPQSGPSLSAARILAWSYEHNNMANFSSMITSGLTVSNSPGMCLTTVCFVSCYLLATLPIMALQTWPDFIVLNCITKHRQ